MFFFFSLSLSLELTSGLGTIEETVLGKNGRNCTIFLLLPLTNTYRKREEKKTRTCLQLCLDLGQ